MVTRRLRNGYEAIADTSIVGRQDPLRMLRMFNITLITTSQPSTIVPLAHTGWVAHADNDTFFEGNHSHHYGQ
jgi:hypothetical protein